MKRPLSPPDTTEPLQVKKQRTPLDMLVDAIRATNFSCQELHLLSCEIYQQYSPKANKVIQNLPYELWIQIQKYQALCVPIWTFLNYRTVCKAWDQSILLAPKLQITRISLEMPSEQPLSRFTNLRTLFLEEGLEPFLDLTICKKLKKLVLLDWSRTLATVRYAQLGSLTQLEVFSTRSLVDIAAFEKLTSLRKLTTSLRGSYNHQNFTDHTNLTSLHVVYCAENCLRFLELPSIKTLISENISLFPSGSRGIWIESDQDFMYDGDWKQSGLDGRGSLWCPRWRWNNPKGKSPYRRTEGLTIAGPHPSEGDSFFGLQWVQDKEVKKENRVCYFDGEWSQNHQHGQGTYFFADGSKWHGTWHKGKSLGGGTFETPQGKTKQGVWDDFSEPYMKEGEQGFWMHPH